MNKESHKDHLDFYKHLSGLSLVTFGGCVTLISALDDHLMLLLAASYLALGSTLQSIYTMKAIVTEDRVPYTQPGPITGRLSLYVPYKLLMASLFLVAIAIAITASASTASIHDSSSQEAKSSKPSKQDAGDRARQNEQLCWTP
jgi:hypothetical protein